MQRILKFRYEERHRHFWSSDWHVYHDPSWEVPIWESRGYLNAQDSAERILEKVNSRVGEDDTLWYLGDMFLNSSDEQVLNWLSQLRCKNIKYIAGNHESNMFRLYRQAVKDQYGLEDVEVYPTKMGNIEFIGNHMEIWIGKKSITMNHFPLRTHNHAGRGSWNLNGHSHNNDKTRNPDFPTGKTCDVSWDWKKDVWSYAELEDVMSTKEIFISDHPR